MKITQRSWILCVVRLRLRSLHASFLYLQHYTVKFLSSNVEHASFN